MAERDYKVWVEVEELDALGNHRAEWGPALEGAAILATPSLDEAIEFGNKVQRAANEIYLLDHLVEMVETYRRWLGENSHVLESSDFPAIEKFDSNRCDWLREIAWEAMSLADRYQGKTD